MSHCNTNTNPNTPILVTWMEDSSATIMARITDRPTSYNAEGTPLTQANLSAITLVVTDTGSGTETLASTSLTISSVIFDTLQGWVKDNIGHNFRYTIGPTAFPTGGAKYVAEVKWTHTDGRTGHTVFEGIAKSLYRS